MPVLLVIALLSSFCQHLGPYVASGNFSADLYGPEDTRAETWGHAEAVEKVITFRPPAGYRVRILRIRGDLLAWPKVLPGQSPVAPGRYSGVLVGWQTTAPEGSVRGDWMADNTMLYVQIATNGAPARASYNDSMSVLLGPDHKLVCKLASWLNTTGYPIHIEPSFTIEYRFERDGR